MVTHALHYQETDDAYVVGHIHQISPRVEGMVTKVLVKDNQLVKAGDALVCIDGQEYEIGLQKARAELAHSQADEAKARAAQEQAKAQLTQTQTEVQQAESRVAQAAAQLQVAKADLGRNARLYSVDSKAVAKADVDVTKGKYDADEAAMNGAKANLESAKAAVSVAEAAVDSAGAQLAAAQATVQTNEAAVKDAERLLSYTTISAPASGRVGNKNVEPGNRVQAGQALMALAEPDVWVIANFKETQLTHMHEGQRVELDIDAFPDHKFSGHLESIAPASGAQFALLPPDNATGNFTKVVQRVPVKVVFDAESVRGYEDRLRPGLSVVVNVAIRE